jgi:hypothetical protein
VDTTAHRTLRLADRSLVIGLGGLAIAGVLTVSAWFTAPDAAPADGPATVALHVSQ